MRILLLRLFLLLFAFTQPSIAKSGGFEQELDRLRYALQIWNMSADGLELHLNPMQGAQNYRLGPKRAPWAGNYFPMEKGGIANRWQQPKEMQIKSLDQIQTGFENYRNLTEDQVAKLSPSEKYDILMGRYDFPVTKYELLNRGPLRNNPPEHWEGFCNGVRCAGINLPEPRRAVTVKNLDGIPIRFEPADLKALSGAAYFYVEKYSQLGGPTQFEKAEHQPNAAIFDLTLRFFLAKKRKAFVIDSHLGPEIWNESVVGFERHISERLNLTNDEQMKFPWAVAKILVKGKLETLGEFNIKKSNNHTKSLVSQGGILGAVPIEYVLYLDSNDNAKDGEWLKDARRTKGVDFVWFGGGSGADAGYRQGPAEETIDFQRIKGLFEKATARPLCSKVLITF